MTTSSFERNRCTRISPSAVLDDRLDGKDLEWARDHLRRCEACRERVEDFVHDFAVIAARTRQHVEGMIGIPDRMQRRRSSQAFDDGLEQRQFRKRLRNPRTLRDSQSRKPGSRLRKKTVGVAVVATFKL